MEDNWIEFTIVTTSEAVEAVQGIIYTTEVEGVSVVDVEDLEYKIQHPGDWDYFDENILPIKEGAVVKAYFNNETEIEGLEVYFRDAIKNLHSIGINPGDFELSYRKVSNQDWENNWKQFYKTTKVGARLVVKPKWEEYSKKDFEEVIELDPGMAFGTGTHETTRMCLQAIERYVDAGKTVYDIGTGSGILAIAAAKLGAKSAIGVDLDEVAVEAAKQNVESNNLEGNIDIRHGNLVEVIDGKADIVVANIIADVIMILTPMVRDCIKDEGIFISSGIIKEKKDEVCASLIKNGFEPIEVNNQGEWICIVAKKHEILR